MGQSLTLPDPEATAALAARVARALPADAVGWTLFLEGELGAGKSTFARAMLRAMGHAGPVPSPTYTLVEPYFLPRYPVYHIDLYRINDTEELEFLGWDDLHDGLKLVEWPERAPAIAAEADLRVEFRYAGEARTATLSGLSERGARLVAGLALAPAEVSS